MSATVSSSFMAMRRNVSRMSRAAASALRVAVRPFRVHVDEAHLDGGERVRQLTVAAVALVTEPRVLVPPVDLLGLPDVLAPAGESEGREPHRLQGAVAGEDHEVGPGDLPAVLLLDRPEQPARLVEVGVVGPAVEGREALLAGPGASAAVADAVGARAVPGHPDEERPVVAVVGRPPVLRRRHHCHDVALQGIEVEGLELLGVVELRAHGIAHGGVLVENAHVELVRPPVSVRQAGSARDRALAVALLVHLSNDCIRTVRHGNPSGDQGGVVRNRVRWSSRGTGPSRGPRPRRSSNRGRRTRSDRACHRRRNRHRR